MIEVVRCPARTRRTTTNFWKRSRYRTVFTICGIRRDSQWLESEVCRSDTRTGEDDPRRAYLTESEENSCTWSNIWQAQLATGAANLQDYNRNEGSRAPTVSAVMTIHCTCTVRRWAFRKEQKKGKGLRPQQPAEANTKHKCTNPLPPTGDRLYKTVNVRHNHSRRAATSGACSVKSCQLF